MATKEDILNAIASDLGIPRWNAEAEAHWTGRCVYSAMGRIALHLLWDDERPDVIGDNDTSSLPVSGKDAPGKGSISFFHFWKGLSRSLGAFAQLFPYAFRNVQNQRADNDSDTDAANLLAEEDREMSNHSEELSTTDWGANPLRCDGVIKRWYQWLFTRYLKTGFLRHSPMRVGPALDRKAALGSVAFLRGSHLDTENVRMSGLAMFLEQHTNATNEAEPFSALRLLPEKRELPPIAVRNDRAQRVRETIQHLQQGNITPITYSTLATADGTEYVRFSVNFTLPDEERNLLLLCSWPESNDNFAEMSNRTATKPLFMGVMEEMKKLGYKFQ